MVLYGHARKGFEYPLIKFAVITESDIFGQEQKKEKEKVYNGKRIQDFAELSIGDYVVHEKHGLGIYRGIEKVEVDKVLKTISRLNTVTEVICIFWRRSWMRCRNIPAQIQPGHRS